MLAIPTTFAFRSAHLPCCMQQHKKWACISTALASCKTVQVQCMLCVCRCPKSNDATAYFIGACVSTYVSLGFGKVIRRKAASITDTVLGRALVTVPFTPTGGHGTSAGRDGSAAHVTSSDACSLRSVAPAAATLGACEYVLHAWQVPL